MYQLETVHPTKPIQAPIVRTQEAGRSSYWGPALRTLKSGGRSEKGNNGISSGILRLPGVNEHTYQVDLSGVSEIKDNLGV